MDCPLGSNNLSSVERACLHLHLRDVNLRKLSQQNSQKALFLGTGSAIVFCSSFCFGLVSRYSVDDSTALGAVCWNGVQQLGVL